MLQAKNQTEGMSLEQPSALGFFMASGIRCDLTSQMFRRVYTGLAGDLRSTARRSLAGWRSVRATIPSKMQQEPGFRVFGFEGLGFRFSKMRLNLVLEC